MKSLTMNLNAAKAVMSSYYYTYAALYCEGYRCCAKTDVPTV